MSGPPACERCGEPVDNKDNAGRYRDTCDACQKAVAQDVDPAGDIDVSHMYDDDTDSGGADDGQ